MEDKADQFFIANSKKLIVKLPNYIGDTIMCLKALYELKETFHDFEITILTSNNLAKLFSYNDFCSDIAVPDWNVHKVFSWKVANYVKKLGNFDVAVTFTNQPRIVLGFKLAGIPMIAGFSKFPNSLLHTISIKKPKEHCNHYTQPELYSYLVKQLGTKMNLTTNVCTEDLELLRVPAKCPEELKQIRDHLKGKSYYVLIVGSANTKRGPSKRWPIKNFISLAERLHNDYSSMIPIFVFGPEEQLLYQQAIDCYSKNVKRDFLFIAPGVIGLDSLISLIHDSKFVVTNDTGPRHIAIELKKKTITLLGPKDTKTCIYKAQYEYPIWVDVGCNTKGCKLWKCKEKHICMTSITPRLVYDTIKTFVFLEDLS